MKYIKSILTALIVSLFLCMPSLAENNVSEIDVNVIVRDDGSCNIVQKWTGTFTEGTENYIPISLNNGIDIKNFKVYDGKGEYKFEDNWDIDAGFNDKKRKCGINPTDSGIELCFGISEYGSNVYYIEYDVEGFIKSYTDYDGTNFMFINPDMSTFPTNGRITVSLENKTPLTEENARIWAFGYEGGVVFNNGTVEAVTSKMLEGSENMIVMLRLNKGVINPSYKADFSFEEVQNAAFEGSDYGEEEGTFFEYLIGYIILFAFFVALGFVLYLILRRRKEIKEFYKNAPYFRDVPNGGRIEVSHFLARKFSLSGKDSLVIGALTLSMINKGCIEPESNEEIKAFGRVKKSVDLKLIKEPENELEKNVYKVFKAAAGSDGILQEKELEKYAYSRPESVSVIIDAAANKGQCEFTDENGFISGSSGTIRNLTETGKTELSQIMGLKKYLEDFSLISEREISETIIWQDYMVYATLLGIADKVIEQFKKVYPERVPEFENYNRNVIIAHSYYNSMYSSSMRAIQEQRSSGLGGNSSLGGGGGFSGGGHGGGSR